MRVFKVTKYPASLRGECQWAFHEYRIYLRPVPLAFPREAFYWSQEWIPPINLHKSCSTQANSRQQYSSPPLLGMKSLSSNWTKSAAATLHWKSLIENKVFCLLRKLLNRCKRRILPTIYSHLWLILGKPSLRCWLQLCWSETWPALEFKL